MDLLQTLAEGLAGRYTIERQVGEGGMATVFLAQDLKHRRQVAIKVLRAELAASIGPERFLREIELAAQLQHPHIVPVLTWAAFMKRRANGRKRPSPTASSSGCGTSPTRCWRGGWRKPSERSRLSLQNRDPDH